MYSLRPMTTLDIPVVAALEQAARPSPWSAVAFAAELENELSSAVVLTVQEEVIGYCVTWLVLDELTVATIAVAAAWRSRGLGALLLLDGLLAGVARGAAVALLEVRRSNTAAQGLYLKYGFEMVGERKGYYRDGEDALLMTAATLDEAWLRQQWAKLNDQLANAASTP